MLTSTSWKWNYSQKCYATCQHHNNSHYMPLLANLIENCCTNIVEGCCQLHLTSGWTSYVDWAWCQPKL